MSLIHTSFLLGGPTQKSMRQWGLRVHAVIGDLKETPIAKIPDLTGVYFKGQTEEALAEAEGTLFFPNALPVTGPSHVCDWVLWMTLTRRQNTDTV